MYDTNLSTFRNRVVVRSYETATQLQPPERALLNQIAVAVQDRPILDLGVGGGRTTPYLAPIASRYVGVDYSPEMIEKCRGLHPGLEFAVADARDLTRFEPASFGFVLFSFNGIDYVGHADRIEILHQIRRLLQPGGFFAFSTHNRNADLLPPWSLTRLRVDPLREPAEFARRLVTYPGGIYHHWRNAPKEVHEQDYAILNDQAHMYSLLTYYIHIPQQIRQLEANGFRNVRVVGLNGSWIDPSQYGTRKDSWIYYLAEAA